MYTSQARFSCRLRSDEKLAVRRLRRSRRCLAGIRLDGVKAKLTINRRTPCPIQNFIKHVDRWKYHGHSENSLSTDSFPRWLLGKKNRSAARMVRLHLGHELAVE